MKKLILLLTIVFAQNSYSADLYTPRAKIGRMGLETQLVELIGLMVTKTEVDDEGKVKSENIKATVAIHDSGLFAFLYQLKSEGKEISIIYSPEQVAEDNCISPEYSYKVNDPKMPRNTCYSVLPSEVIVY